MKGINRIILVFPLMLFAFILCAQPDPNIDNLKPNKLLKFGKNYEKAGDIYGAIEYYHRYYMIKMEKIEVAHKLAKLYMKSRNYEKARDYYLRCYMSDPRYIECLFYYAKMLKMTGDYDKAMEYFEIFKKRYKGRELRKTIKEEIESLEYAQKLRKDSMDVEIEHFNPSINKAHIEFNPIIYNDNTLIFGALREDKVNYYSKDEQKPKRKFYVAKKQGQDWKFAKEFDGPFNSDVYNTGNGSFSPNGKRFYFTRCTEKNMKMHCKIFVSEKDSSKKWQEPEEVPVINDPIFSNTQPTVGKESKRGREIIYFISDRAKGRGGLDIWYSEYDPKKESFSKPKNAGRKINTEKDEITPYYSNSDRKLYYSSNGLPGMGGFDIFRTTGEQRKWLKPVNIGFPVNSFTDDLDYTITKDKTTAYFTSNRPGGTPLQNETCCDDLYSVLYKDRVEIKFNGIVYEIKEENTDKLKITKDYINKNLLHNAIVSLYLVTKELDEPILAGTDTTDEKGYYSFDLENKSDYKITVKKDGYFSEKFLYNTKNIKDLKAEQTTLPVGLKIIPKKAIRLSNIYYQYDKSNLTQSAKATLDTTLLFILNEMPDLIVEISAHTDAKGNDDYNMKLSQKRAESVVEYLIRKGIDKKRLQAKGYGETQPIAPNKLPNGKDNPDGRALNRRTEFKVIGSFDENSKFYIEQ